MMLDGNVVQDVDIFLKEHYQKINDEKKILQDILNFVKSSDNILNNEVEGRIDHVPKHSDSSDASSMRQSHQDNCLEATLRYGDFFPLNPVFQISNRPMFGFGECEEQRRRFLAKKKHEYLQYLTKTKNEEEEPKKKELSTSKADNRQNTNVSKLSCPKPVHRTLRKPREIFSPGRGLVEETDRCFKRWQQQVYKRELDEQVSERRKRLDEEKMRDREEYKMKQDDMMFEYSRYSQSPINHSTLDQNSNNIMMEKNETNSLEHFVAKKKNQSAFCQDTTSEADINVPLREQDASSRNHKPKSEYDSGDFLKNFLYSDELAKDSNRSDSNHLSSGLVDESQQFGKHYSNQSSESNRGHSVGYATHKLQEYTPTFSKTTKSDRIEPETKSDSKITLDEIANSKAYQKLQQERYKNELAQQIEEKNRLKIERKIEEEKEEKKLEWKAKQEEEKLRLEFEREQAEIAYRAAQKVQQELRHQEFLNKIHEKKAYERKKNVEPISELTSTKGLVHPTAHYRAIDEGRVIKNIHFPITSGTDCNKNKIRDDGNTLKTNPKSDSDMVIEAPYMLAVQGDFCLKNSNAVDDPERPSSPPVPAITTKKILKCHPKIETFIPSTVSMTEKTKKQFVKDSTLLANLSEIRRKLLERQKDSL